MTNFKIIQKRNLWLGISLVMFLVFGASLLKYGLKYGIDFTGGSSLEVRFAGDRPTVQVVEAAIKNDKEIGDIGSLVIVPVGDKEMNLRFQQTSEEKHQAVLKALGNIKQENAPKDAKLVEELSFDSVGSSIGQELRSKSFNLIVLVLLAIIVFISYSFRHVSKPVASWKYGVASVVALVHDTIITLGIFAYLGHKFGYEINTPFVAAILTVMGYSNHDTIVVFDRVRENLPKSSEDFEGTVNTSLNQTLIRSINTSITSLLALLAVFFFGGDSIKVFVLALIIGISIGTYSSIFVASPLLVVWQKWSEKK